MAALLLIAKGYRIVATNKRTPFGEIDIAALKADTLAIIEVKTRGSALEGHSAIHAGQAARLMNAGQHMAAHMKHAPAHIRCDAIIFSPGRLPVHIKNAF